MVFSPSALLRVLAFVALCFFSDRSLCAETGSAPGKLAVKWGSDLFGWWKIELEDQNVIYTKHYADKPEDRIQNTPQANDWKTFRKDLDELRVWQWRSSYPNTAGVVDGAQWTAEIVYSDKFLKVAADNNYPDANGRAVPDLRSTDTFRSFVAALWKLMGNTTEAKPPTN